MSRQHRQDEQHFIPDQLAGFRIGDRVRLSKVSTPLTVIGLQPPSLLVLESDRGQQFRAGWKAVERDTSRH